MLRLNVCPPSTARARGDAEDGRARWRRVRVRVGARRAAAVPRGDAGYMTAKAALLAFVEALTPSTWARHARNAMCRA